jgi:hypothetical protein
VDDRLSIIVIIIHLLGRAPTGTTRGAGESKWSTTQARPRVNEYARDEPSPSPDLGTTAGSCEPTTQPPTIRSMALAPEDSNVRMGLSDERKTVVTRHAQKGRAGGQGIYRFSEWGKGYKCDPKSPFPYHSDLSRSEAHEGQVQRHSEGEFG